MATVIVTWVLQSEVAQCLETANCLGVKHVYQKPWFLTWCNHSWQALMLPITAAYHYRQTGRVYWLDDLERQFGVTPKQLVGISFCLGFVYLIGDYLWFIALPATSVAAATAIFNCSVCFVYVLGALLLRDEPFTLKKSFAVAVALGGVAVMVLTPTDTAHRKGDGDGGGSSSSSTSCVGGGKLSETMPGNIFIALAALAYAFYEVGFKRQVSMRYPGADDSIVCVNTISGLIGLTNVVFLWIGMVVLDHVPKDAHTGPCIHYHEHFALPTGDATGALVLTGFLGFLFNVSFMLALALTSPLLVSLGCLVTIPFSALCDYFLQSTKFTGWDVLGSALIAAAFAILVLAQRQEDKRKQQEQKQRRLDACDEEEQQLAGAGGGTAASPVIDGAECAEDEDAARATENGGVHTVAVGGGEGMHEPLLMTAL